MAQPVLKKKKKIAIPAGTESVVVTFRKVKRKGGIKDARKVAIPRAAAQAIIRIKKGCKQSEPKPAIKSGS